MTEASKEVYSGGWNENVKWVYQWNPRDQMTSAAKYELGSATWSGRVVYRYCLSCEGALSERIQSDPSAVTSWKRYEYDGLSLLRVDERYDESGGSITTGDPWRTVEVSTYRPGALAALLGKRVYTHTDNDDVPEVTTDYSYGYDAVGNVMTVFDEDGNEEYYFSQDAFGNELEIGAFDGDDWDSAADAGVLEHQTGKRLDAFTGLYYFHARWYDAGVGRFVGRSVLRADMEPAYNYCYDNPITLVDANGKMVWAKAFDWLIKNSHRMEDFVKKMCKCGGPVGKQIAKKHEKFRQQVCEYTDKALKQAKRRKEVTLEEHVKKLAGDPEGYASRGWKVTIQRNLEQLAILNEEIAKRAGSAGTVGVIACCPEKACSEGDTSERPCTLPACNEPDPNSWTIWDYVVDILIPCEGGAW